MKLRPFDLMGGSVLSVEHDNGAVTVVGERNGMAFSITVPAEKVKYWRSVARGGNRRRVNDKQG